MKILLYILILFIFFNLNAKNYIFESNANNTVKIQLDILMEKNIFIQKTLAFGKIVMVIMEMKSV